MGNKTSTYIYAGELLPLVAACRLLWDGELNVRFFVYGTTIVIGVCLIVSIELWKGGIFSFLYQQIFKNSILKNTREKYNYKLRELQGNLEELKEQHKNEMANLEKIDSAIEYLFDNKPEWAFSVNEAYLEMRHKSDDTKKESTTFILK